MFISYWNASDILYNEPSNNFVLVALYIEFLGFHVNVLLFICFCNIL